MEKNNVKTTVAIDIRGFCAQCGITITERLSLIHI